MRIHVYYIGKPRNASANAMAGDFRERISHYARCEMREIQPERFDVFARHPSAAHILLDPSGKTLSSAQFASWMKDAEQQARGLVFVIGGADGLPEAWKSRATMLLSLSAMTFPHELARVMLLEQIYRAFATLRGHPYPR